jgi:hypothetical protein
LPPSTVKQESNHSLSTEQSLFSSSRFLMVRRHRHLRVPRPSSFVVLSLRSRQRRLARTELLRSPRSGVGAAGDFQACSFAIHSIYTIYNFCTGSGNIDGLFLMKEEIFCIYQDTRFLLDLSLVGECNMSNNFDVILQRIPDADLITRLTQPAVQCPTFHPANSLQHLSPVRAPQSPYDQHMMQPARRCNKVHPANSLQHLNP